MFIIKKNHLPEHTCIISPRITTTTTPTSNSHLQPLTPYMARKILCLQVTQQHVLDAFSL
jgi:hypothetical protein